MLCKPVDASVDLGVDRTLRAAPSLQENTMPRIDALPHDTFDPDTLAAVKGHFGGMGPNLAAAFAG